MVHPYIVARVSTGCFWCPGDLCSGLRLGLASAECSTAHTNLSLHLKFRDILKAVEAGEGLGLNSRKFSHFSEAGQVKGYPPTALRGLRRGPMLG